MKIIKDHEIGPGRVTDEIRFAVVMYGGISLCIYMNGIADQLLCLVRSTARKSWNDPQSPFLYDDADLSQIERVYRRVALARTAEDAGTRKLPKGKISKVRCRFVVDVLSGTSAGGLNNLFLARALANEERLDPLAKLWIEEGEIASLLNDRGSASPKGNVVVAHPPQSLLNSRRMAQRLLEAMRTMEEEAKKVKITGSSRLVRRLDLYMTATDLKGLDQSLDIPSDDTISETQHRAVFHFVHDPNDGGYLDGQTNRRNDFDPRVTPFLTFVARSTSCIVPAFEPMRLDDIGDLEDDGPAAVHYDRDASPLVYSAFFREYWRNAEALRAKADPLKRAQTLDDAKRAFRYRAFGDGGYGDNYPFGYAIDEVSRRTADVRVDRKLLYVEPDPDLPKLADLPLTDPGRPNVVEHVSGMFGVKTTETIRGDIDALRARNRLLERVEAVRRAAGAMSDEPLPPPIAYWKLCASAATDELADLFAAVIGFETSSPYGEAIRALVKAIRRNVYHDETEAGVLRFLDCFDLASLRRRIAYERRAILESCRPSRGDRRRLTQLAGYALDLQRLPAFIRTAAASAQEAAQAPRREVPEPGQTAIPSSPTTPTSRRTLALAAKIAEERLSADAFLAAFARLGPSTGDEELPYHIRLEDLGRIVVGNPIRWGECGGAEPDAERVAAAWKLLAEERDGTTSGGAARVRNMADELCALYAKVVDPIRQGLGTDKAAAFLAADQITFPALYGAGQAESAHIDVLRVSPLDCKTLVDRPEDAKTKLAGTGFGHFSGFFKDSWRAADILWGRLDGAERLICTVLGEGAVRRKLILQAQVAILAEAEKDLQTTVESLDLQRSKEDRLEPQNGIRAMRRKLLLLALDRFLLWSATDDPITGMAPADPRSDPDLASLVGPTSVARNPQHAQYPALRQRLLAAAWEGF